MEVVISLDNRKLLRHLKGCPKKYHYIHLGDKKGKIGQLLQVYALRELNLPGDSSRESFLQSYIDLVGKLGQQHNSIYWWASFTASKNRFISKLSPNLSLLCSLVNTFKENPGKDILVINPPEEICGSIRKYCLANSINFRQLYSPWRSALKTWRRAGGRAVSVVSFLGDSWRKIRIANKYLGKKFAREVSHEGKHYVLRSWFYSGTITEKGEYRDTFFGTLPDYLIKKGKKLLVIAGIAGDYEPIVKKIANHTGCLIIPQEFFLSYFDPIRAVIAIACNRIKIKGKIDFDGSDVSDIVRAEINREFRDKGVLGTLLYYYWMRRLVNKVNVDTFTTTCENNPWERMCIMAVRRYSPETKVVGYQHTVVPQASANMFVSTYEKEVVPLPDRILTVGKASKEIMERYGYFEKGRIQESCALRFEYLFNIKPRPRSRSNRILVALEGVSGVYHMVNYVLRELKDSVEYKIKIRTHPVMPLNQIMHKLEYDIGSFPHVYLSQNASLEKDLDESDIVIYWGSTVALEALMMGKAIIHFNLGVELGGILSFDPLFECNYLKRVVNKDTILVKVIEEIYSMTDEEYYLELGKAKEYLSNYFYRITDSALDKFIV